MDVSPWTGKVVTQESRSDGTRRGNATTFNHAIASRFNCRVQPGPPDLHPGLMHVVPPELLRALTA
jgi:hypothetical protein